LGLGMRFFIIQMAGVIVYSTDNMIITQLYGPAEVVPYNIAFKYLSIITIGYSIIVTPYWSAITEAYVKEEFEWIRRSMRNLNRIALLFMVLTVVFVFGSDIFYRFWIGDYIRIPKLLSALMGLYVIIQVFQTPFLYFINGTGKVKLQLVALVSAALINIPLSILFAKYLQLGSAGVILATALCLMPVLILARIQYHRIINKTAKGIWNE
jgi:O-antigen/teichoic acid export membrane protein